MNERKLGVQNTMRERERRGEKERERATAACGACESERDDQQ